MSSPWASVVPDGTVPKDYPPPFRRPLCPSSRVGFAPISTKSGESRAERAGRPGPAHRGQRRLELGANSYEVLVPRSPMGACIHAPWPWPRGDQKMRERQRQTATKPRYYIRGIEITAHFRSRPVWGGRGGLARDFEHHHHVVHLGLGRASWHGTQGLLPRHFDGLYWPSSRVGFAPIPTKSGASRASGWICGSRERRRPGPAHRGQRRTRPPAAGTRSRPDTAEDCGSDCGSGVSSWAGTATRF